MVSDLPKYMRSVLKFSIKDNGYLSSLPYLSMWIFIMLSTWFNDWIIRKKMISTTNARKLFATISLMGPGIFLVIASYANCDKLLVVVMFVCGMSLMGCSYPSLMINPLDLSPNYAGTLMAFGNSIASLCGVLTPYVIGVLTPNQTVSEWRSVFWIVFSIAILTNALFVAFATGKVQEWNNPDFIKNAKLKKKQEIEDVFYKI